MENGFTSSIPAEVRLAGAYGASGSSIALTSSLGAHDTLTVEPHSHDGLLVTQNNVELYPANCLQQRSSNLK